MSVLDTEGQTTPLDQQLAAVTRPSLEGSSVQMDTRGPGAKAYPCCTFTHLTSSYPPGGAAKLISEVF